MGFQFAGELTAKRAYKRKNGSEGTILQFVSNRADGSVHLQEFTVPEGVDPTQFEVGRPCAFPVEVGGRDAYYKMLPTPRGR